MVVFSWKDWRIYLVSRFHNNVAPTLEDATRFYTTDVFAESVSGKDGGRFELTEDDILAIGVFLRAVNALENIRSSIALATDLQRASGRERIPEIVAHTEDAIFVLTELEAPISPDGVAKLERALGEEREALETRDRRKRNRALRRAIEHLQAADDLIVDRSTTVAMSQR
jgi:hypothetical protein